MASTADTTGQHVHTLLAAHSKRLVKLHPQVLEDRDPEPLHQMRVAMRRLRTCLIQFAPALDLPAGVSAQRLARSGRRLGLARDLDVLRERLDTRLLPRLSDAETRQLKPVFKRLKRERRDAQHELRSELHSGRYLKLLQALQGWLRDPSFTPLGEQPLSDWLPEWQWPWLGTLLLHPAWWLTDGTGAEEQELLHELRKGIKGARYRLENLQPASGDTALSWVERLKRAQELLGDLHDLAVLRDAIEQQLPQTLATQMPELHALLVEQQGSSWSGWRALAPHLLDPGERRQLLLGLLQDQANSSPQRATV
ncbi:CHAD domain-containing protein [Cyanobium sp. PCC 7001]|uniref:CHAD domain-containing protein n=1 Tax=Cyanobium sp. PCC 7001 TaxID=180281 RepID=UPI00031181AF|nr:CHAD domain-containing protein [Cyanobium sp. PCC 7001]